jgi:hypothetical protein
MADSNERIEALELALLRAWAGGDRKVIKRLLSRRFRLVIGASSPVMLDHASFLGAAGSRWALGGFRIGAQVYVRKVDGVGIYAAEVELDTRIDGRDCSGSWWMVDLWRKSGLARSWRLLDRQLSRPEETGMVPDSVRALQLWR